MPAAALRTPAPNTAPQRGATATQRTGTQRGAGAQRGLGPRRRAGHLQAVPANPAAHAPAVVLPVPGERPPDLAPTPARIQRLALAAFEVLEGTRALGQLAGAVTPEVARTLKWRRTARTERRTLYGDQRVIVATPGPAHLSEPRPGVIEATVVLHARGRTSAVALRFELLGTHWRATHLTVL
ncbi:hypothetical protein D3228_04655 [Leucobacter luti]|nr:hypothetical protein [Leucobacter luti]